MAIIGKKFAILESGKVKLSGLPALVAWAGIHLAYLPQDNRLEVLFRWVKTSPPGREGSPHHPRGPATSARRA